MSVPVPPAIYTITGSHRGSSRSQEAIALWEKLRRHDTKEAEKKQLAIQILALVKGHVVDLAASPTASRVIQVCGTLMTSSLPGLVCKCEGCLCRRGGTQ